MTRSVSLKMISAGIALISVVSFSSATDQAAPVTTTITTDSLLSLTIEELAKFDGKEGRKAYVALDSIIYNVTDAKAWKNGEHKGNKAGTDITKKITKSPHGKKPIAKLPKVGKLVPSVEPAVADTTKK